MNWIYLGAASFLDRIGVRDIIQNGSGSGVCMFITYGPGWIFRTDFQMRRNIRKARLFFLKQQLLSPDMGMDL